MADPDPLDPTAPPLEPASHEERRRSEVTVAELYEDALESPALGRPDWPWPTWTLHGLGSP